MVLSKLIHIFVSLFKIMFMIEESKIRFNKQLSEIKPKAQINDTVINVLAEDPIGDYKFKSQIRIVPLELVEKLGINILQDEEEYQKYFKPEFDPFLQEWARQLEKLWNDKVRLLDLYTRRSDELISPFETFNRLAIILRRIQRRTILLMPVDPSKKEVKPVVQKHIRQSGEEKEYKVLRSYWIDERGDRKRLISRHLSDRYENLEKEIASLFFDRGYGVQRDYKSPLGHRYDLVIERDGMKSVVEIKSITEGAFNHLFLFDALLSKFKEDHPED